MDNISFKLGPTSLVSPLASGSDSDSASPSIQLTTSGTGESGDPKMVTGYRDQDGQPVSLTPPVALSAFRETVEAGATEQLASLQGANFSVQGGMVLNQEIPSDIVLNTAGTPRQVTGYVLNGVVETNLPPAFQGLTPQAFVNAVNSTFSGPMTALQGLSAASSSISFPTDSITTEGSLYIGADPITGQNSVLGYRDSAGIEQTLDPPQTLQQFLKNVENPTSNLHSLSGKSLSTLEVSFSAPVDAPITICGISPEIRLRASEILPPPTAQIRTNAYLEPSVSAKITVLLMTVAAFKIEIGKEEDRAILATMDASISESQARQLTIQQKNDAEIIQAQAAIASACMKIVGAFVTIGASMGAERTYSKSIAPKEENTSVTNLTPPKQETTPQAPDPTSAPKPGDAAGLASQNTTKSMQANDAANHERQETSVAAPASAALATEAAAPKSSKADWEAYATSTKSADEERDKAKFSRAEAGQCKEQAGVANARAEFLTHELNKPSCPERSKPSMKLERSMCVKQSVELNKQAKMHTANANAFEDKALKFDSKAAEHRTNATALDDEQKDKVYSETTDTAPDAKAVEDKKMTSGENDPYAALAALSPPVDRTVPGLGGKENEKAYSMANDTAPDAKAVAAEMKTSKTDPYAALAALSPPVDRTVPALGGDEIAITGSGATDPASTAPTAAATAGTQADTTPKGPSDTDKASAVEILRGRQTISQNLGSVFSSAGDVVEKTMQLGSIVTKNKAEKAEAYLNAFKQLNETVMGQLTSDRGAIDSEFKGTLDALKAVADREVQNLGQLFGVR